MREQTKQVQLFAEDDWRQTFNLIPKLPYAFSYQFEDADGRKTPLFELPTGWELTDLRVPDAWIGHAVDALPPEVLTEVVPLVVARVTVDGTSERVAATPEIVLRELDELVVLGRSEAIARLRADAAQGAE